MRDESEDLFPQPGASPMGALLKRHFEGSDIRITDRNGDPWFVATDVAKLLGYAEAKDLTRTLPDDEKGRHVLPTPGGDQEMNIISEGGLMRAISQRRVSAGLDVEIADKIARFQRWLYHEVLPSIRKTGGYGAKAEEPRKLGSRDVQATFKAYHSIAKMIGLSGNRAVLAANRATVKQTGVDPLADMDATHLASETQEEILNATAVGVALGGISAKETNQRLLARGYQVPSTDPHHSSWKPTDKGAAFGLWVDTNKRHNGGMTIHTWRWRAGIIDQLRAEPAMALVTSDNHDGAA